MTDAKLRSVITEAVSLDREIAEKQDRLKSLKEAIVAEAESRADELVDNIGAGKAWTGEGNDGCVARVSFYAPSLKATINGESRDGAKLLERVGKFRDSLLTPVLVYKPIENFRERVRQLIGGREATAIIAAAETKSAPRVNFETKEKEK